MRVYECLQSELELIDDILPLTVFREDKIIRVSQTKNEMRLDYDLQDMPFDINGAHFIVLPQDIHNDIPCGTLFLSVPIGEDFDIITYIVRFEEKEFKKIKNFCLTKSPK